MSDKLKLVGHNSRERAGLLLYSTPNSLDVESPQFETIHTK